MKNVYRIALACLYLLQLAVIFHGAVLQLGEHVKADGDETQKVSPSNSEGFLLFIKRAFSQREQSNMAYAAADRHGRDPNHDKVVQNGHDVVHETHPAEHKDRVRRQKRTPLKEYLVANLYGGFRRFLPVATAPLDANSQIFRVLLYATC